LLRLRRKGGGQAGDGGGEQRRTEWRENDVHVRITKLERPPLCSDIIRLLLPERKYF
jgi:hypothetical protein